VPSDGSVFHRLFIRRENMTVRYSKVILLAAVCSVQVFITGCTMTTEDKCTWLYDCDGFKQQQFQTWVGQPVSNAATRFGPPIGSFDTGPGRKTFQFSLARQSLGVAMPMGDGVIYRAPQLQQCLISFNARTARPNPTFGDWIIEGWAYSGQC
jgi:hypothetical protein